MEIQTNNTGLYYWESQNKPTHRLKCSLQERTQDDAMRKVSSINGFEIT